MALSTQQKVRLEMLLKVGDEQKAIEFLQQELNLSVTEAQNAVEKLKPSVTSLETEPLHTYNSKKSNGKPKMHPGMGIVFILIGIALLVFAGYTIKLKYEFIESAVTVTGKVIDFETHQSKDDDGDYTTMYAPVYEYEYNGDTYLHRSDVSSGSPSYEIGEGVALFIQPDAPEKVIVDSFSERWFVVLMMGGFGIAFLGAGYTTFRTSKKNIAK